MGKSKVGVRAGLLGRVAALLAIAALGSGVGQTYVFQRLFDVETLDPIGDFSPWGQSVIENLYEGLYGVEGMSTELRPRLATGHEVSADGRTHTFRLREGVRFHGGNPFTCRDVEYSLERALVADPGLVGEALIGTAANALVELGEDGSDAAYEAYFARVADSVECLDDHTAVVRSLEPDAILFAALAGVRYVIVDSALVKANGGWDGTETTRRDWLGADLTAGYLHDHAAGTGAFRLASWEPGVRLVAERNPDYWGAAPRLEKVVYEVVEDEEARVAALLAGEADQIDVRFTPWSELEGLAGVRLIGGPGDAATPPSVRVVGAAFFNQDMGADSPLIGSGRFDGHGVPPDFFSDVDARKCFAYAWDTGEDDPEYLADGAFFPSMLLLPFYAAYDPTIPRYGLDLAKAEEHCRAAWGGRLWEAGMYIAVPREDWLGALWKENIEALNPKFEIDVVDMSAEDSARLWDELRLPWVNNAGYASFPDPYEFMADWYQSSTSFTARLGYVNEEIDRLVALARREFDATKRDEAYRRVGRLAYEDAPFVIMPSIPYRVVVSARVEGAYRNPLFTEVRWADLSKRD